MIHINDYLDNDFMLNSSQESTNFIRSRFDYGTRQRRGLKGYPKYNVKIILSLYELKSFKTMWDDLYDGTDTFYTDQTIRGEAGVNKIVRFITSYGLREIGGLKYEVSCIIEILSTSSLCPLIIGDHTIIGDNTIIC